MVQPLNLWVHHPGPPRSKYTETQTRSPFLHDYRRGRGRMQDAYIQVWAPSQTSVPHLQCRAHSHPRHHYRSWFDSVHWVGKETANSFYKHHQCYWENKRTLGIPKTLTLHRLVQKCGGPKVLLSVLNNVVKVIYTKCTCNGKLQERNTGTKMKFPEVCRQWNVKDRAYFL